MVGAGMIFDETYRPFFEGAYKTGLYDRRFGAFEVQLTGIASRTGSRADAYRESAQGRINEFQSFREPESARAAVERGSRLCLRGDTG